MTTINCTLDCEHQKDGKCILDDAEEPGTVTESCAYYSPSKEKKKTTAIGLSDKSVPKPHF